MTDFEAQVKTAAEKAVPTDYIDPEHQGQDLEMLQAFYQACGGEGGTADEIHLRGIKAALATLQTASPVPSTPSEGLTAVAAFAQDMRARGVGSAAIVQHVTELLTLYPRINLANQQADGGLRELKDLIQRHLDRVEMPEPFPVDWTALHDPDFSDGLSSIEHLNRLSGVAPSRPAWPLTQEGITAWLEARASLPVRLIDPDITCAATPAYWADDVPAIILEALKLWGQVAPASAQPAAIAQPANDPTDDELLRTYGAAKRNHQYDGPSDDWPNRAERAATVYGLRAVLTRYGRPTFQPIPVSERLPGPDDCCPNPRNGKGQWCWGWVQPGGMDRDDPIPYSGCWRMLRWDWPSTEALAWAPWWAFPLPGATEMVGEGQPCSP
jgi:hypothetical protein